MGKGVFVILDVDEEGKPNRIHVTAGKTGSNDAASACTINHLANVMLEAGLSLKDICGAMRGIRAQVWHYEGDTLLSIGDAAAQGLEHLTDQVNHEAMVKTKRIHEAVQTDDPCPDCGVGLVRAGGCEECRSCGYSKCG